MEKNEKMKLVNSGVTVLRPQYEARKNCWKIAKATRNGGWCRFGGSWYITQGDALAKIDEIVNRDPDKYKKD